MEDCVGSYDSNDNRIDSFRDSISQYGDMFKAAEENQKSALMKNLEEENRRLMEENKELTEKEVNRSLKAQMNAEWVKKICSELEMKEQEIISLTAALQQANGEVEHLESERCGSNTMKMKMTTELERKDMVLVALKNMHHKMNADWQQMEQEVCVIERYNKYSVAEMEEEWEMEMETLTTSHESALSQVCSQLEALHKDVELHERNAAETIKQLQEKDDTIHAMETTYGDLQKQHLTLTNVEQNQQWQMDLLMKENAELKELALMTDKQKAKKQKEQDKAEKKNRKKDGKLGFLRKFFSCFAWCKV